MQNQPNMKQPILNEYPLLNVACAGEVKVYVDGVSIKQAIKNKGFGGNLRFRIPASTEVLGIACQESDNGYGLKASTLGGRIVTDTKNWLCSSKETPGWAEPEFRDKTGTFS